MHNPMGQATGYQLKPDKPKKVAKYVWASSSWLGNSIYLPNGDAPLFVWKNPEAKAPRVVWLCEGALKSLLVALRLWRDGIHVAVIGTATSANYPRETFKQYLAQLNPQIVRLFPDGGVGTNNGIRSANLKTINQIENFGYQVEVAWWGQFDKSAGDIDELTDWKEIQYLSPDGFKIELGIDEDQEEHTHQLRRSHSSRIISKEEWWEKFGFPRTVASFADLLASKFKKANQPNQPKQLEKQGFKKEEFNISKVFDHDPVITYVPGELPTVLEWAELG